MLAAGVALQRLLSQLAGATSGPAEPKPLRTPALTLPHPFFSLLFLRCSSNPEFTNFISSILRAFLDEKQ
jgi:hypothetical protein